MHGVGKYTTTDGTVYFGEFRNGERDGIGRLMLLEGTYRTVWRNGREIDRQEITDRGSADAAARFRQAAAASGVKVRLLLDQKKFTEFENADPDSESHPYEAENGPGTMTIRLASREMMKAWKSDGDIASGREGGVPYVLNLWQFPPLFLKAEVENGEGRPVQITGAFIDVFDSATDPTPYLEVHLDQPVCCGNAVDFTPVFNFENFGWGNVRNARISYSLGTEAQRTAETTVQLGTFDAQKKVSLIEHLRQFGVDVNRLRRAGMRVGDRPDRDNPNRMTCGYEEAEIEACFEKLKNSGIFGKFKDYVFRRPDDSAFYTTLTGRIEYQWQDRAGKSTAHVSQYAIDIQLGIFNFPQGEEGGVYPQERPFKSTALSLDRRAYRIPLPRTWNANLIAAETKELELTLSAPKSSQHSFQLVLQLADGTQAKSPTVDLSYFRPRVAKKWKAPQ
jgi:hypothetical protein